MPVANLEDGLDRPSHPSSGMRAGALGLLDSTVMAVASTAPAYSLTATLYLLVAAVGLASPAAILVSFLPVLGIALAYSYMNRTNPNCGASYAWLTQAVSPWVGWFTGWVQTAASVLFLVQAPSVAGQNTLNFLSSVGLLPAGASNNTLAIALVGIAWLALTTAMVVYGIQIASRFQWVLLTIEYVVVVGFSLAALVLVATRHPTGSRPFSWSWLNPFSIPGVDGLAAGAVLAVFIFWGWDTAANVSEETRNARTAPGQAGVIAMFILLFIYLLASVAMQEYLPANQIVNAQSDGLRYFASRIASGPWSSIMLLAVLSSTVATVQTTLLPAARVTLAMARDGVWPRFFTIVHPRFKTPWIGTLVLAGAAAVGLLLSTLATDPAGTLANLVAGIGILIAFYYGVTGLACAWYFRRLLLKDAKTLLLAGVLPLVGGVFLLWVGYEVFIQTLQQSGWAAVLPCFIALLLGFPFTIAAWWANHGYFSLRAGRADQDALLSA